MRLLTYHKPAGLLTCQCWDRQRHSRRTPAVYPQCDSSKGIRETNDCTVWATAKAFGVTWWRARCEMARRGRKPRRGVSMHLALKDEGEFLGTRYESVFDCWENKDPATWKPVKITLRTFVRRFPKGRYVVIVAGHALAVIDGVLVDCAASGGDLRRVRKAWKIVENNACTNQSSVR